MVSSYSEMLRKKFGGQLGAAGDEYICYTVEGAQRMQQLISAVHGKIYTPEQASQLYPTAGDTTDWTYGEYAMPSFTIELRPRTQGEGGFILPASQIAPTWEENRPAALEFIRATLEAPTAVGAGAVGSE